MNIKPLGDRVVIKKLEAEEKTKGGIVLPGQAKEQPLMAEVVAVGPGAVEDGKTIPMDVKVGDRVIFSKYAGTEIKYDGEEYTIVSQRDILAILFTITPNIFNLSSDIASIVINACYAVHWFCSKYIEHTQQGTYCEVSYITLILRVFAYLPCIIK